VADYPGFLEILTELFETRFGGWQQPDEMDPCRVGLGGCPVQWTSGYELRKLTVSFSRTHASAPIQDAAQITFHLLNLTGSDPDATWTSSDYGTAETALAAWWTSMKVYFPSSTAMASCSWRADGPAFRPFGSSLSPTLRNTLLGGAGTGTGEGLPPQIATTVTEVTDAKYTAHDVEGVGDQLRNRWGRFYLPPLLASSVVAGRIQAGVAGSIATYTQTLYNAWVAADLVPVMYSPTTGAAWSVKEIHVDDIFDVIRSRRYVTPLQRWPKTIDTA